MFDRIKKAFSKAPKEPPASELQSSQFAAGPVSEWAATQGFGFSVDGKGQGIALEGKVGGHPWRLHLGRPTRNYILGTEVRARAEVGIPEHIAVLVMNRPLKEALEKRAFQIYTEGLQTSVDTSLPEEMRWLSMFEEVGWESLPEPFWQRFSVLSDNRDHALAWVEPGLARLMTEWPVPGPSSEVPFMVLMLNGKAYLRMEYTPAEMQTLQHAARIFTAACESALANLAGKR